MQKVDSSDNELYICFQNGNETAFDILYNRYWKILLYKALQKLESEDDAEEVVQDTLMVLWERRKDIHIKGQFRNYLSAILKYKILERLAKGKKNKEENNRYSSGLKLDANTTEEWVLFEDMKSVLETAISELPEKCQLVFRMSREKGFSDKEIAKELGLSQKTVESHITKALKTLRSKLGRLSFLLFLFY